MVAFIPQNLRQSRKPPPDRREPPRHASLSHSGLSHIGYGCPRTGLQATHTGRRPAGGVVELPRLCIRGRMVPALPQRRRQHLQGLPNAPACTRTSCPGTYCEIVRLASDAVSPRLKPFPRLGRDRGHPSRHADLIHNAALRPIERGCRRGLHRQRSGPFKPRHPWRIACGRYRNVWVRIRSRNSLGGSTHMRPQLNFLSAKPHTIR